MMAAENRPRSAFAALQRTRMAARYGLAVTRHELAAVRALRSMSWTGSDFTRQLVESAFVDQQDEASHARVIMVHVGSSLAGTIRIHLLSPDEASFGPTGALNPEGLSELLRDKPGPIIDLAGLAICPQAARQHPGLPYLMLRAGFQAASWFGARSCIAAVRHDLQSMYRRVLCCKFLTPGWAARQRPALLETMVTDVGLHWPRVLARYPFFAAGKEDWAAILGERLPA
ncbi:MAG: hypothetical protein NTW56_03560 [Alphaproteobacteria bacterium]|nr:hypothetical protein [Alphaproteobacteria bacterium]